MPHRTCHRAILLRTFDVGDADRFCIFLTADLGKIAARARGVRKMKSRLGGTLLPLRAVYLEITSLGSGHLITAATSLSRPSFSDGDVRSVTMAQEGLELLLALLPDEAPVPELFELTLEFLHLIPEKYPGLLLAFTLRALGILGFLPESTNAEFFEGLSEAERNFIRACRHRAPLRIIAQIETLFLKKRTEVLLAHGTSSPLRSPAVSEALR